MSQALLFDVNETLLDLTALDPLFETIFGDRAARHDWFERALMSALTVTATGGYQPFDGVAAAALSVTGEHFGQRPNPDERARIATAMRRLPAHPEVAAALDQLYRAGYRLVALSNSPGEMLHAQLDHAGLLPRFDAVLSAGEAGALKPSPAVYRYATEQMTML